MKVRARELEESEVASKLSPYLKQRFVTPGKEYEVHAIAVFDAIVFIQTVDDVGNPAWTPSVKFDVSDFAIPGDWICNILTGQPADDVVMLLGPEFVAKSQASYAAMVELEADKVDQFWKRLDAIKKSDASR